ncbi:hypothetical protein KCP70_08490 [Salmonella enterica subsp. enterica]|nr:hypothetical protein KCP70_08490 [Salmonella enterica subsp. enterica]
MTIVARQILPVDTFDPNKRRARSARAFVWFIIFARSQRCTSASPVHFRPASMNAFASGRGAVESTSHWGVRCDRTDFRCGRRFHCWVAAGAAALDRAGCQANGAA